MTFTGDFLQAHQKRYLVLPASTGLTSAAPGAVRSPKRRPTSKLPACKAESLSLERSEGFMSCLSCFVKVYEEARIAWKFMYLVTVAMQAI
jgi:hypothetical protein